MLTKSDLKQIGRVVDEAVEKKVGSIVEEKLGPIKGDITLIKGDISSIKGEVKYLRRKVNRIDRTVSLIVKNYDEGDVRLERRVKIIERHLDLPENN